MTLQSGDAPTPSSNQKKTPNATPTSNKKQQQQTPGSSQKTKKVVLKGGLLVEDVKEGHGPEARPGATVRGLAKYNVGRTVTSFYISNIIVSDFYF